MMDKSGLTSGTAMANLAILLEDRGVIAIGGGECRDFLQNLITNDVDLLSETQAIYAALLTPQGKYLYDFLLAEHENTVLVDVNSSQLPDFLRKLMMYRLRAAVTLEDASDDWEIYALLGDIPGLGTEGGQCMTVDGGIILRDPRAAKIGARALLVKDTATQTLAALGFTMANRADYEERRISLGVVDGVADMEQEKTLLLEANFEDLHGVAFNKGCYVGQEQTARTKHRATIRNRIYPVAFDGDAPVSGTPITVDGKEIGTMRSTAGNRGLARLRVESVDSGAALTAAGTILTVKELDL
jgi:tRNA-modifying protein YgfZ